MARAYTLSMVSFDDDVGHEDHLLGIYTTRKQAEKVKRFLEKAVRDMGRLYDDTNKPEDYTFHIDNALVDSPDLTSTFNFALRRIENIDRRRTRAIRHPVSGAVIARGSKSRAAFR